MPAIQLRFSLPPVPGQPLHLRFGAEGGGVFPEYKATARGRISGLRGRVGVAAAYPTMARGRISGLRGRVGAAWDADVERPVVASHVSAFDEARAIVAPVSARFERAAPSGAPFLAPFDQALRTGTVGGDRFEQAQPNAIGRAQGFDEAISAGASRASFFEQAAAHAVGLGQHFEQARAGGTGVRSDYQQAIARTTGVLGYLEDAIASGAAVGFAFNRAGERRTALLWSGLQQAMPPWASKLRPVPVHVCYDPRLPLRLRFATPFVPGLPLHLRFFCWGKRDDTEPPEPHIVVPARKVYIVINEIDVRRVDGNMPLPTMEATLAIDKDSWTWQMSATMHRAALPNLAPARFGEPVEIEFKVNSAPYRMIVESIQREWQHPTQRIVVRGRGKNAVLDAPYAPSLSFTNDSQRTAEQLMNDALTINGVSIGWRVDFGLVDWVIPAGAWMHQGSYISAIKAIAEAAGGYVQPHPTAQILRILPNYPVAPWDWGGIVPNIELPMNPVEVESVEWITKPEYNQVHLMGEVGGAFAEVYRGGTARDLAAEMVVDPLITHADVARQRGRAVLSDTGHQAMVRWSLPVLPETGLIMPGQFVRREHEGEVFQGYVRSLNMNWDRPTLRQVIEVQAHG